MNRRDFLKLSGGIFANTVFFPSCKKGAKKIEGFGSSATGGSGGRTIWVSDPDDLRYALELAEPRTIYMEDGLYELESPIEIYSGNVTLAGKDATITGRGIRLFANNAIFNNIRIRPGDLSYPSDSLEITNSWDVVVDHCSFSDSVDELFQVTGGGRITVQWCIFSNPIGDHPYGPWTQHNVQGLTMHHNLVANCQTRLPDIYGGKVDLRNHIVINPGNSRINIVARDGPIEINIVNTQYIGGVQNSSLTVENRDYEPRVYLEGNVCEAIHPVYDYERKPDEWFVDEPFNYPYVKTHSIEDAYKLIMNRAGAFPRDEKDSILIGNIHDNT